MNKGEKPKHSYWTEGAFIEKRNDRGRLIAQCKICNKILQNTAINRLKDHRRECRYESSSSLDTPDENHADDDIRNNYESALDDHNYEGPLRKNPKIACKDDRQDHAYVIHERLSVNPQFLQTCKEGARTSEVNKRQTKVKSFVDNVTSNERRKIDKALLNFFVAFKLDFKEMESVYFKDFLNVIRPAYAVPNNNHMLNDVLNEAHQKVFTTDSLKSKLVPVLLVLNVDESTIIDLLRNVENKYVYVM